MLKKECQFQMQKGMATTLDCHCECRVTIIQELMNYLSLLAFDITFSLCYKFLRGREEVR